jgi:hypothetical protein
MANMDDKSEGEVAQVQTPPEDYATVVVEEKAWRPRRQEYLIMTSLSLISLMVALDASILVPALPVRFFPSYLPFRYPGNPSVVSIDESYTRTQL